MERGSDTEPEHEESHPSPADFHTFLPWACSQLQVEKVVVVTKVVQQDYISISGLSEKGKAKQKKPKPTSRLDLESDQEREVKSVSPSLASEDNVVNILAVYDSNENLVQIKFDRNPKIPRTILKLIGLIIQYQLSLNSLTINRGMDQYSLYEICKFLPYSNITDLCLDNSFLKEANYHILLENQNFIRQLSLARCSITDKVIKNISETLAYPLPTSKTLSILNLASNRITDLGCKYLAEALRSNRQLSYLNLADNMLSDSGAAEIMKTLAKFPLTFNELLASRYRHMAYLKQKNELVIRIALQLRASDYDRRSLKRKSIKPVTPVSKKKGLDKEASLKSIPDTKSINNMDYALLEKAAAAAENTLGEFKDPYNKPNTFVESGIVYSYGNNALCYLNFSYNSLSYISIKIMLEVLDYQRKVDRKPRGLVNISIKGNSLPVSCKEFVLINQILDTNLSLHQRRHSGHKKRPASKPGSGKSGF